MKKHNNKRRTNDLDNSNEVSIIKIRTDNNINSNHKSVDFRNNCFFSSILISPTYKILPEKVQFELIDKLTNSIENVKSGENFKTLILPFLPNDEGFSKSKWVFDWIKESNETKSKVFKLVTAENLRVYE